MTPPNLKRFNNQDIQPYIRGVQKPADEYALLLAQESEVNFSIQCRTREGKTTTVANLAITYANLGKTILVDTDLRRPVVHKVFNLEREPGVTNFLAGQTEDISTLIKETEVDNQVSLHQELFRQTHLKCSVLRR